MSWLASMHSTGHRKGGRCPTLSSSECKVLTINPRSLCGLRIEITWEGGGIVRRNADIEIRHPYLRKTTDF